jgi:hypothetical protein
MEPYDSKSQLHAVVEQTANNTTTWIGHRPGETVNRISGQTFICPEEGDLSCIEIFSAYVNQNGPVELTIHDFDRADKTWGPVIGGATVEFKRNETGKWIAFPIAGLHLQKNGSYGFRLKSEAVLAGLGEAAGSYDHLPYTDGQEWYAYSGDQPGNFYSYLSLSFKVEMRA